MLNADNETLDSIRDINLSYLMLAQRLLHDGHKAGMFRLGLSAPLADLLSTLTRAWTLVRIFNGGILQMTPCPCCGGRFIGHNYELHGRKACVICQPPPRADAVSIGRCKLQINPLVSVFGHPCLPGVRQGADRRRVDVEAPRRVWGFVVSRCF
ncbi:FlhC family transcriptional regulator [Burkholderia ubonensis]|uniref:FlhC family transcriptional regulator n=1 Tax=Burkholderia ubonensis TaxID=101571 RepID=UPI0038CD257C